MKTIWWILVVANLIGILYWGYDIFFKPKYYKYPVFMGNELDRMVIWKREKVEAPIPKFAHCFKERLLRKAIEVK